MTTRATLYRRPVDAPRCRWLRDHHPRQPRSGHHRRTEVGRERRAAGACGVISREEIDARANARWGSGLRVQQSCDRAGPAFFGSSQLSGGPRPTPARDGANGRASTASAASTTTAESARSSARPRDFGSASAATLVITSAPGTPDARSAASRGPPRSRGPAARLANAARRRYRRAPGGPSPVSPTSLPSLSTSSRTSAGSGSRSSVSDIAMFCASGELIEQNDPLADDAEAIDGGEPVGAVGDVVVARADTRISPCSGSVAPVTRFTNTSAIV